MDKINCEKCCYVSDSTVRWVAEKHTQQPPDVYIIIELRSYKICNKYLTNIKGISSSLWWLTYGNRGEITRSVVANLLALNDTTEYRELRE